MRLSLHYNICGALGDGEGDRIGARRLPFGFGGWPVGCRHGEDVYGFAGQSGEG